MTRTWSLQSDPVIQIMARRVLKAKALPFGSDCGRGFGSVFRHQYSKSQPLSVGIFFAYSPSENRNDVARVASAAARFPARFPPFPLSVISRDASARDATSIIFNDLQAAGARSNLVGRWGIENAWSVCLLLITWSRYRQALECECWNEEHTAATACLDASTAPAR